MRREYDSIYPTIPTKVKHDKMFEKPRRILAKEIMSKNIVSFKPDDHVTKAIDALLYHNITGAPVVEDNNMLIGIISEKDLLQLALSEAFMNSMEGYIEDYMTTHVISIRPETDLYEIAQLLNQYSFRRVPVTEGTKVVGVVSRKDALTCLQKLLTS